MSAPRCPLCGSLAVTRMERVADGDFFAGSVIESPLSGGRLWRCIRCGSKFRWPTLSASALQALYSEGRAEQWAGSGQRIDFQRLHARLARKNGLRSVLDIGCGTGDFLAALPAHVERFGVEPSREAAIRSESRGIQVLGADIFTLDAEKQFDAISVIDVLEHLADPLEFLDAAWSHVRADGLLLISTGDPACLPWQMMGARFWYVSFPEHLVFPSHRFFERWATGRHARCEHSRFPYYRRRIPSVLAGLVAQLAYAISPWAFDRVGRAMATVLRAPQPRRRHYSPGIPGVFVDHQLVVLCKDS